MLPTIMKVLGVCAVLIVLPSCATIRDCVKNDEEACKTIEDKSPVVIVPRKDKPPKLRVKAGVEGCKWGGNPLKKEVKLVCKWDVEF